MSGSVFYDASGLDRVAINLFYGWGYNFYRQENQLRADDLLIREKAGFLLGQSRAMLEAEQSAYRRTRLPPPTRAQPLPPPEAIEAARALEDLSTAIGSLEGTIRALPVPEADRMTQRYRQEAETLAMLAACDQRLIGLAEGLRATLDGRDHGWILANQATIREALRLLAARVRERQALLK
nr:hypothetical protein [uncultured Rhodopila sp.]